MRSSSFCAFLLGDFAGKTGVEQINLEVRSDNSRAIALYKKFGFRKLCTFPGFSVNVDMPLEALDKEQIRSFILPGGNISDIDTPEVKAYLQALMKREILIAGICAGVDVLDHAGILCDVISTHSSDADLVTDKNVITARANAYVDFAVEVAKKLDLFASEDDLQETINFWKHYQRVQ